LERRALRAASRELTQMLVLGYTLGLASLGLGLYKFYIAQEAWDTFWLAVAWAGAVEVLATLVTPLVWRGPERVLRRIGNWLGGKIMAAILALVYFAFFWPVGALLRAIQGSHPIYTWESAATSGMEGWRDKVLPADLVCAQDASGRRGRRRLGLFSVLAFFVRRGHFFLIPALLVLVSIGIALFFLQTSALAPFIYTLF
jgi:hypothetical protein